MSAPTVKSVKVSQFDELTPKSFAEQHPLLIERVMQTALVIGLAGGACLALYSLRAGYRVCRLEGLHAAVTLKFWGSILGFYVGNVASILTVKKGMQRLEQARLDHVHNNV